MMTTRGGREQKKGVVFFSQQTERSLTFFMNIGVHFCNLTQFSGPFHSLGWYWSLTTALNPSYFILPPKAWFLFSSYCAPMHQKDYQADQRADYSWNPILVVQIGARFLAEHIEQCLLVLGRIISKVLWFLRSNHLFLPVDSQIRWRLVGIELLTEVYEHRDWYRITQNWGAMREKGQKSRMHSLFSLRSLVIWVCVAWSGKRLSDWGLTLFLSNFYGLLGIFEVIKGPEKRQSWALVYDSSRAWRGGAVNQNKKQQNRENP